MLSCVHPRHVEICPWGEKIKTVEREVKAKYEISEIHSKWTRRFRNKKKAIKGEGGKVIGDKA